MPSLGMCVHVSVWTSVHEARVCVYLHLHVHVYISVFVSLLLSHSLHLARTQIVEDGERVSGRSPGLPLSGLELGRALARCPFWLFSGWAPCFLGINSHFQIPELSVS